MTEFRAVNCSPKYGGEPFGGTEQIDVLADKAGVDRGIETPFHERDVGHAFTVSDVHEVERRGGDKILKSGLSAARCGTGAAGAKDNCGALAASGY